MKLLRAAFHGLCGFDGGELDLRDVPPGLVALTGPNWQGKTTYLELPLAAWFREWASRENNDITRWADARDAWVESDLDVDGTIYRARVNVDGQTRKSQAVLSRKRTTGSWEYLTDGKVSTFDVAVAQLLPPKDALLCSQFAAQNRAGSLTTASRSKRKDLFIQFLWLEHLVAMSETAKLCCNIADATARAMRTNLARLEQETSPEREAQLRQAHDDARQAHADFGLKVGGLKLRIAAAERRLAELVEDAAAHREASAEHARLAKDATVWRDRVDGFQESLAAVDAQHASDVAAAEARRAKALAAIDAKKAHVQALVQDRDAIAAAVVERAALTDERGRVLVRQAELPDERAQLEAQLRDVRAAELRDRVPCAKFAVTAGQFDSCQFLVNAAAAAGRLDGRTEAMLLEALSALGAEQKTLTARLEGLKRQLAAVGAVADKQAALDVAADRLEEYENACADIEDQHATATAQITARWEETHSGILRQLTEGQAHLVGVRVAQDAVARVMIETAGASAQVADLEGTLERARADLGTLERDRGASSVRIEDSARALDELQAKRERTALMRARLTEVETALRVQSLLAKVLHRDGLPTLEIASAAPAISQLTTDLLEHSGFGVRFRVDVTTLVPTADGKEWKEDFAIRVWDNDRNKEILGVGDLSGGERVLVEEALRAALTIYMASRHTHHVRTCWRDETTGPLDAENRPKYIRMLRRLRELGGYDHVLFISQTSDVVEMADTVFDVSAGKATRR